MSPVEIRKNDVHLVTLPDRLEGQVKLGDNLFTNVKPQKYPRVGLIMSRVYRGPLVRPPKPDIHIGRITTGSPRILSDAKSKIKYSARYVPPDPQARNPGKINH